MHRLSRISVSFSSKKNDQADGGSGEKSDKKFPRPSILQLPNKKESMDAVNENSRHDEWYEMITAVTPSNDEMSKIDQKMDNDNGMNDTLTTTSNMLVESSLQQIDMEPDNAAEIEALEQSLFALLDDFRSGRMCALGEERLKMMQQARHEMEDLTAFHVKLHKIQAPNFSASSGDSGLDEEYDALFRKLDNLHGFLYDMSFGGTFTKKENSTPDINVEENDGKQS